MQYPHLADVLAPVINHPLPDGTRARLQALFHEMIRTDLGKLPDLVLPDLVTLTELKVPEMWLPLRRNGAKEGAMVGLFQVRLQRI